MVLSHLTEVSGLALTSSRSSTSWVHGEKYSPEYHSISPSSKLWSWTSSNKKCWPRASKGSGWMKPQVGQNPNSSITFAAFSAITLENPMVSLDFQEWGLRSNNLHKLRELRALCWIEWAVWGAFNCPDAVVAIRSVWLSEYAKSFCCATFYTVESNHMMLSMRLEEMHKGWWLPPD